MLNLASLAVTLPILAAGLLGVFLAVGVLVAAVLLLGRLTGENPRDKS